MTPRMKVRGVAVQVGMVGMDMRKDDSERDAIDYKDVPNWGLGDSLC